MVVGPVVSKVVGSQVMVGPVVDPFGPKVVGSQVMVGSREDMDPGVVGTFLGKVVVGADDGK